MLRSGLVLVTGAALPPEAGPLLDLRDERDLDAADAKLDAVRTAVRTEGKAARQDELVGLARRLCGSLDRAPAGHDLRPRLAWCAFYAAYMVAHGWLDQADWWRARSWMGMACDLAREAGDPEMALLARCGMAATKTFAGQPGSAVGDLRMLGWGSEVDLGPSPEAVALDVEGFTALARTAPGDATRRVLERALFAASRLGDEPPGRVIARPMVESVALWGGFALAEVEDGTEQVEAQRLLSRSLAGAQRSRNLMAEAEARSALALVLARRGNSDAARAMAVDAHEGAARLRSRRTAQRVRRARALLAAS